MFLPGKQSTATMIPFLNCFVLPTGRIVLFLLFPDRRAHPLVPNQFRLYIGWFRQSTLFIFIPLPHVPCPDSGIVRIYRPASHPCCSVPSAQGNRFPAFQTHASFLHMRYVHPPLLTALHICCNHPSFPNPTMPPSPFRP